MASFPGATKSDKFRGDPNDLYVLGIDGDDDEHPFFNEEQMSRALEAEKDEAWLADLGSGGVHTSVKLYRLAKHRGKADAPTFVLVGQRRVMGLRTINARRKTRGLQAFEIPFEMYTVPQSVEGNEADRLAYRVYISENEGRRDTSMTAKAQQVARYLLPVDKGGFGGTKKECAESMEVTEMQITHLMNLLKTEPQVQEAARTNEIPASAAVALAKLPPEEQLKELPKMIEQFKAGKITVKDAQRQVRNKARPIEEQEAKVAGRRVWARVVELVDDETINLARPAARGSAEVKGIDEAVYQMAKYLSTGDIKAVPYLKAALAKAGFEA